MARRIGAFESRTTPFFRRHRQSWLRRLKWVLCSVLALFVAGWTGCVTQKGATDTAAPAEANTVPGEDGPPSVRALVAPLFADGPLAEARQHFEDERWAAAADAFAKALADETVTLTDEERRSARYIAGVASLRAGRNADAERLLEGVAAEDPVLQGLATLYAAEAALGSGRHSAAIDLALKVDDADHRAPYARLLVGLGLAAQNDTAGAEAAFLSVLEAGSGAVKRRARLGLGDVLVAKQRYVEAAEHFRVLVAEAGRTPEGVAAAKALQAIAAKLPDESVEPPTESPDARFARAKKLFAAHRSEQAIAALEAVRKATDRAKAPERWCEATYLIGKSYTKLRKHDDASRYYDETVQGCEGTEHHLNALYNGGRAHWNADRGKEAIDRFETLTRTYATDSLADDAMLLVARIELEAGDTVAAEATLRKQVQSYPQGDMAKDAHWLLFRTVYAAGRLEDAIAYVDLVGEAAGEDDLYTRGRLAYFRARALEQLGRSAEAVDALEAIVRNYPLSYYGLLADGRLIGLDAARAAALRAELRSGPYLPEQDAVRVKPASLLADVAFLRGVRLLRMGMFDDARAELDHMSMASSPEVEWTKTALYDIAGAFPLSHRMAESLLTDAETYPDGDARARWALAYPRPFLSSVLSAAAAQGLQAELVYSIMREESGFQPRIESWANALGLMQLMLPTAKSVAPLAGRPEPTAAELLVAENNIPLGAAYLGKLSRGYADHPLLVIAGYNGGQGNVGRWLEERGEQPLDLWIEDIPYGQTRNYTKRVSTTYWRYRWLYAEGEVLEGLDPAEKAKDAAKAE